MSKNSYYISWYTWLDQSIQTPWDFWYLSQGSRYKPRSHADGNDVSEQDLIDAFEAGNSDKLEQLDINYINDVKLVAFVQADSPEMAQQQVKSIFADAEFEKIQPVDADTQNQIIELFAQTASKKPA